jgi:F-BAR domain only protein
MQAMTTITGNLHAMAKELDVAHKKADKLKEKGGKAAAGKVATAASEVENAQSQWDSQAPYIFERLQEVDETRCDNLRKVLTQYQTHVIESESATSNSAEDCLNALLNLQIADEIKTFATKVTSRRHSTEPRKSRTEPTPPPHAPSSSLAPTPSIPHHDDGSSQRSSSCKLTTYI